jgi:tetratricopeptide (TPR) repeat protein
MKKITHISKIIISSILIGGLTSSLLAEDILKDEVYLKGLSEYKNNSFDKSYESFNKYLEKNSMDKSIAFMLGRSAFEIGKYDEALNFYNIVLKEEPDNLRVKLEIAQSYFQLKKYDDAKIIFEEVLKRDDVPTQVKKNIELSLASLDTKNKKNFVKTTLVFGLGYDSNIDNYSDDYINRSSANKRSDETYQVIASVNHTYKLEETLALENKFLAYTNQYTTYSEKDMDLVVLGTALSYFQKDYKLSLGLDYNHIWLDGNHYLNNYILTPSILYKIDKDLDYSAYLKIMKKDFKQTDTNYKDSLLFELQNSLSLKTEDFGVNIFSFTFGKDNKDDGSHYNVDNDFMSLKYENKYALSKTLMLTNSIELYKDIYKEDDPIYNDTRRTNEKITLSSGFIKSIDKNIAVGANISYVDNKSNQDLFYTYDKYSLKTNLYYSF